MPKLTLSKDGVTKVFTVSDNFTSLPPAEQEKTVDEMWGSVQGQQHASSPPTGNGYDSALEDLSAPDAMEYGGDPPDPGLGAGMAYGMRVGWDRAAEALAFGVGSMAHWVGVTGWTPGKDTEEADAPIEAGMNTPDVPGFGVGQTVGGLIDSALISHGIGQAAAGVGAGLSTLPYVGETAGALSKVANLNSATKAIATIPKAAAQGGKFGAAVGLVNADQGGGNTARSVASNAIMGAGAAGGLTSIGVAGQLARYLGTPVVKSFLRSLEPAEQRVYSVVLDTLRKQGVSPERAVAKIKGLGPYGFPGDIPELSGLAEGVVNQPGPVGQIAQAIIQARKEGTESRVSNAIKAVTGQVGDVHASFDELAAQRSAAAAPLFASLERIKPTKDELKQLDLFIRSPEGQNALRSGLTTMRRQALAAGTKFQPKQYGLKTLPGGTMTIEPGHPSMPLLHAIKEGFDDLVEVHRDPLTGQLSRSKEVASLDGLRSAYREAVKDLYPRYKSALDAWSGPSRSMRMQDMGRRVLTNDQEVTAKMVSKFSENDKKFFLNGFSRALLDRITGNAGTANDARAIFGNTLIRSKIKAALGNDEAYEKFAREMEQEIQIADSNAKLGANSVTTRRIQNVTDLQRAKVGARSALRLATHNHWGAVGDLVTALSTRPNEDYMTEMQRLLLTPNSADAFGSKLGLDTPVTPPAN